MLQTIAIVDYGSGNLRSAAKAFERVVADEGLNYEVRVTSKAEDAAKAARIVLPGQGAFGDCMNGLKSLSGMVDALTESVLKKGKPFFGICVGMQLMATQGFEHGMHRGLGWIESDVVRMEPADKSLKIPHMGWNEVFCNSDHPMLRSITKSPVHFYFVHSFMMQCKNTAHVLADTNYGMSVCAIAGRDNMVGTQFHPEKSQKAGLDLISGFLKWDPDKNK